MDNPHPAQSASKPPEHWPQDVYPIALEGLDFLGVDSQGRLFWDGKPIEIRKAIDLSRWQTIGAVVVALAAVVGAIAACISAYAAMLSVPGR
jgi:hypothetical protein